MDALASLFMPAGLRPYDGAQDVPRDVGLGGLSTEYLATNDAPGGGFWNVPQVWWTSGGPVVVSPEQAQGFAQDYEAATLKRFPRFDTPGAGAFAAMNRSAMGGAQASPLAAMYGGRPE